MCEMRGDLFVWCPEDELMYTTNLKCLHSNTRQYRQVFQVKYKFSALNLYFSLKNYRGHTLSYLLNSVNHLIFIIY